MRRNKKGKLIAASLGPGDAGLITRKPWAVMQSDAMWCYPVWRKGGKSYALGIVERTGLIIPEKYWRRVYGRQS